MRVALETVDGSQQVYNVRPYEEYGDSIKIYFAIQLDQPFANESETDWMQDVSFLRGDRVFRLTPVSIDGLPLYKEDVRASSMFKEWDAIRKELAELRKERDTLHKIVYQVDEGL